MRIRPLLNKFCVSLKYFALSFLCLAMPLVYSDDLSDEIQKAEERIKAKYTSKATIKRELSALRSIVNDDDLSDKGKIKAIRKRFPTKNGKRKDKQHKDTKKKNDIVKFTIGFDPEFPPYGYKDEKTGDYIGFDIDLAREVASRRGWELVLKPIAWDEKDMELKSKTIDCIWNGFTINGREGNYTFTEPYCCNEQVIVVTKTSTIRTLADLKGKIVMVQADTPIKVALEKYGDLYEKLGSTFKELKTASDYNRAMQELDVGAVDAVAINKIIAEEILAKQPGKFRILVETLISEQYGVGFLLGNEALRDKVQETLKEMVKDGTAAKISKKWFNCNVIILKP